MVLTNTAAKGNCYRVFSWSGRPVLSLPIGCPSQVKRAGIGLYKPLSARRWLFRAALTGATYLGVDAFLGNRARTPVPACPDFPFEEFVAMVGQKLGQADLQGIVSFPSDPSRDRFYVNLLSPRAVQAGFAKVSLSSATDSCFEREAQAIREMAALPNRSFQVPKVLAEGRISSHRFLVLEPLPGNASPMAEGWEGTTQRCRDELSVGTRRVQSIGELSWWPAFQEMAAEVTPLSEEVQSWPQQTVEVCRAHGDFSRANLCRDGRAIWLYDWEDTAADAPVMTDEVTFFLERRPRRLLSRPDQVATSLGRRFLAQSAGEARKDLAMALAFLCSRGNASGTIMAERWHRIVANQPKASHMSSSYRDRFLSGDDAVSYELREYGKNSVGELVWQPEKRFLSALVRQLRSKLDHIDYLDFACGTGRIISYMEDKVDTATGIDVSEAMLAKSAARVRGATLLNKDITAEGEEVEARYDLITGFRFLLNAEPDLRKRAMRQLALSLKGPESRLVVNTHGNPWSYRLLFIPYHWLNARLNGRKLAGYMTNRTAVSVIEESGLEVERVVAMGFVSGKFLKFLPWSLCLWLELNLARIPVLRPLGVNRVFVCRLLDRPGV